MAWPDFINAPAGLEKHLGARHPPRELTAILRRAFAEESGNINDYRVGAPKISQESVA